MFAEQVKAQLDGLDSGTHFLNFEVADRTLQVQLEIVPDVATMLIMFHGAINLEKRAPPVFAWGFKELSGLTHRLSIFDPGIDVERNIGVAWYAGSHDFDTQSHINSLILAISEYLNVTKRIYFGQSSGGFAALAMSHRDPGSYVVAGNPQTSIARYGGPYSTWYRIVAWPEITSNDDLDTMEFSNLSNLYAKGFQNKVIYVQSIGDRRHFENHMLPFVGALQHVSDRNRLVVHSDFWGELGHVASPEVYSAWIKAICTTSSKYFRDILTAFYAISEASGPAAMPAASKAKVKDKGFSKRDLDLAKLLSSQS